MVYKVLVCKVNIKILCHRWLNGYNVSINAFSWYNIYIFLVHYINDISKLKHASFHIAVDLLNYEYKPVGLPGAPNSSKIQGGGGCRDSQYLTKGVLE